MIALNKERTARRGRYCVELMETLAQITNLRQRQREILQENPLSVFADLFLPKNFI